MHVTAAEPAGRPGAEPRHRRLSWTIDSLLQGGKRLHEARPANARRLALILVVVSNGAAQHRSTINTGPSIDFATCWHTDKPNRPGTRTNIHLNAPAVSDPVRRTIVVAALSRKTQISHGRRHSAIESMSPLAPPLTHADASRGTFAARM